MKIARYEHHGFAHVGIVRGGSVHKVEADLDVLDILNLPTAGRNAIGAEAGRHHRIAIEEVRLLPPVEPRAMRDFVAFESHITAMKTAEPGDGTVPSQWYDAPAFLFMNPWALVGATDAIPVPPDTQALDFELELAAVVGRTCRDVTAAEAASAIVGYTICNDWSSRDIQGQEMRVGLGPSKGKDFATTLGPWITTSDELADHRVDGRLALEMSVAVNGTVIGQDSSANMAWSFEELLAHAARGAVVGAGDVLAGGTCSGGSLAEAWARAGRQDPPPLVPGDVVTITIEELGTISNVIVAGGPYPPAAPRAAARTRASV